MKKKVINLGSHSLRDLDIIVSDVLDAVESETRRRLGLREDRRPQETEGDIEKEPGTPPGKIRKHQRQAPPPGTEAANRVPEDRSAKAAVINVEPRRKTVHEGPVFPDNWVDISPEFETELDRSEDVLFDKDEEIFIRQSVAFLKSRDNKDVIIARIWNLLTEAEPDAFYSPEEDDEDGCGGKRSTLSASGEELEGEGSGEDEGV